MKRFSFFMFFFFFVFFANVSFGQSVSFDNVKEIEIGESVTLQSGQSVLFIPKKVPQEDPFEPLDPTWQPQQTYVKIKNLTGEFFEVPEITHIPSFFVYVQVLPDLSAVITERFSLI